MNNTQKWTLGILTTLLVVLITISAYRDGYKKGATDGYQQAVHMTYDRGFMDESDRWFNSFREMPAICLKDPETDILRLVDGVNNFRFTLDCQTFMRLYKEQNPMRDILCEKVTDEYGNVVKNGELTCSVDGPISSLLTY